MNGGRESNTWSVRGLRTRYTPKSRLGHGMVSMAPWLDFVLILFIFLLMNQRLVLQPGVVVSLPKAEFTQGTRVGLVAVVLSMANAGTGQREQIVFFDDERFLVKSESQMQGLALAMSARLKEHPDAALVLQSDEDVPQGTIVELVSIAGGVGIQKINVAIRPR
ncbi:MAG: biopolymer transporter ExbD [Lentisphaerae bacterium]|nr:biopolymer transporter ExbD [Lentisphaerota bacterium]